MKLTSSSAARRRTAKAALRSFGGPQMPSPVRRIAPKPRRCTEISPPSETSPAKLAESSFLFMIDLQYFSSNQIPRWRSRLQPFNGQRPKPESFMRSDIASLLAKPLWVGVGAVEPMTRFIKLELACFRGFCRFCQKRGNLGRIHRLKTAGCLKSLLKNQERIAARDNNTGRKIHSVVKALHRGGCFALENNVITDGLHAEHADIVLEQDGQNFLFETIEVRVHYVERHLYGIEREAVF